jgi:AcrR family transcriptional regulator
MKRAYELKKRAERQDETRRRITEATVALHQEVGPAKTTVAEIARRAGVQRLTVYNHFPDDIDLLGACQAHWLALHPPPDTTALAAVADGSARLRLALGGLYAWFRETEPMTAHIERDASLVPALAELQGATQRPAMEALRALLADGFRTRAGTKARKRLEAALVLATSFATWRSLARDGGLNDGEAVEVAARAVEAAA